MNNKKNRKKILVIWIFLTSLLLTTTTYAWFTTNRVVTINSFNIHVAAEGGLEISADAISWKAILSLDDLNYAKNTYPNSRNQIPYVFEPVSTGGTVTNGLLNLYHGSPINEGTDFLLTTRKMVEEEGFGDESDGNFIAFDAFFKASSEMTIYLSTASKVAYASAENPGIENAIRVAFLNEGTIDANTDTALVQNMNSANRAYIWEPNYDTHTQYGVSNALNTYGITTTTTNASIIPYDGVINEINTGDHILLQEANSNKYPNFFRRVNIDYATQKDFDENQVLFTLEPGITKMRIYMWIEGQDVDCENNSSMGDVTIDLQITSNPS